jgi:hypothetical protein
MQDFVKHLRSRQENFPTLNRFLQAYGFALSGTDWGGKAVLEIFLAMQYREIQPAPALPGYVECLWRLEGEAGSEVTADCQNAHGAEIMSA